jgi:hypothetical protein
MASPDTPAETPHRMKSPCARVPDPIDRPRGLSMGSGPPATNRRLAARFLPAGRFGLADHPDSLLFFVYVAWAARSANR